jgi:excisionase family DNA binding protein
MNLAGNKLLYKPMELCALLGFSRAKIYAMIAAGELPSIRCGRSVRVPAAALQEWISQQMAA